MVAAPTQGFSLKCFFLSAALSLSASLLCAQSGLVTADRKFCGFGPKACEASVSTAGFVNDPGKTDGSNSNRVGPRFDVTQFGAVGNNSNDDTAAIQAAFNACYRNGVQPYGGIVEFPGGRSFLISNTINTYDSCQIEGVGLGGSGITYGSNEPPTIVWKGPAAGTVFSFSQFTAKLNTQSLYTASNPPAPVPHVAQPYIVTVESPNTLRVNDWVIFRGCTTLAGLEINNLVGQVAAASSGSFTVTYPATLFHAGTITDNCTATQINVAFAYNAIARNQQAVSNIVVEDEPGIASSNIMGVDMYFGSRVDSGTKIRNVSLDGISPYFAFYFANGGIDVDFADGWRSDAHAQIAEVYWRSGYGGSGFRMESGSLSSSTTVAGANLMIDNQGCGGPTKASLENTTFEEDAAFLPGYGAITLLACPTIFNAPQFRLDIKSGGTLCAMKVAGTNCPSIVMYPANDSALLLEASNTIFGNTRGAGSTPAFVGLPGLLRGNMTGNVGYTSHLTYSMDYKSLGIGGSTAESEAGSQTLGDFNFNQIWQYGTQASALLYADTSFAALPNGTTLAVGQVLAPPSYWANPTPGKRFALNVVRQAGTTGTPNYGVTTCSTTATANQFSCAGPSASISSTRCSANLLTVNTSPNTFGASQQIFIEGTGEYFLNGGVFFISSVTHGSFTAPYFCGTFTGNSSEPGTAKAITSSTVDLSYGQFISVGSVTHKQIAGINALNPAAVLVNVNGGVGTISNPVPLTFSAPVLGLEMQFPTKSAAAPSALAWSQGDIEENSKATANGVAAWVNVAEGTPGAWAGIPLGNSSGQIVASQISGTTGSGNVVLAKSPVVNGLSDSGTTRLNNVTIAGTCSGCNGSNIRTAQAFCAGPATASSVLTMFGAGSATTSCSSRVGGESAAQLLMNTNGSVSSLAVRCARSGISSLSGVFSVWDLPSGTPMSGADSGVNTRLTVTYGTVKANTTLFDTAHTFAYAKGDLLRIQFTTQANETLGNCDASFDY